MSISRSVAAILSEHVTLELEGIDRMYLNVYVPRLQREAGVAGFFRFHRGHRFVSSVLMDPISKAFVAQLEALATQQAVPVVTFRKGERKDDVAARFLQGFAGDEGILFIGKAQEKAPVLRTERRRHDKTGATYPMAGALHGDGQREVVHQRPRMAQAPTRFRRHRGGYSGEPRYRPAQPSPVDLRAPD